MCLRSNQIVLILRLTDSSLKIPEEKAVKVATKIEKELFSFFRDTDAKYKNKYRSLMFNLKDPKNKVSVMLASMDFYVFHFLEHIGISGCNIMYLKFIHYSETRITSLFRTCNLNKAFLLVNLAKNSI